MKLGLWQQMLFIEFKYKDCVLIFKADLNFLMFFELISQ